MPGQVTGNGNGDRALRPYRKRRPLPALIVIGVLAVGAIVVWVNAALSKADVDAAVRCDPAPTPPPGVTFTSLPHAALDGRAPIPPDKISLKVLNASSVRGQGGITSNSLRDLGFTGVGDPSNDPAYPDKPPKCRGQIRFGENGAAAARTLSLVVPCVELVQDNRKDAGVDLVTGGSFGDVQPRPEAKKVLDQLTAWSKAHQGGGGSSEQSAGAGVPVIDPTLLSAARDVQC